MSRLKRLLGVAFALIGVLVLLIHTPLVEQPLRKLIERKAADAGVALSMGDLDLNLFTLSVWVKNIDAQTEVVSATLAQVHVNADSGILRGRIALDAVEVSDGAVKITPPTGPPPEEAAPPPKIPAIRLGRASIKGVTVVAADQERPLDLALEDIAVDYEEEEFNLRLTVPPGRVAARDLPRLNLAVDGLTQSFTSWEHLDLRLTSDASRIALNGRLDPHLQAYVTLDALLAEDLLPEQPGLELIAEVSGHNASLQVNGNRRILEAERNFSLQTQVDLIGEWLHAPINLTVDNLMSADVNVYRGPTCIDADVTVTSVTEELNQRFGIALDRAVLEGQLQLPDNNIQDLQAWLDIEARGAQNADIQLFAAEGATSFTASLNPYDGALLLVDGTLDNMFDANRLLRLQTTGDLNGLDGLLSLGVELPPDLCSGAIVFDGDMETDFSAWSVPRFHLKAQDAGLNGVLVDNLLIEVSGPAENLVGNIFSDALNPREPMLYFALDSRAKAFHTFQLDLDSDALNLAGYNGRVLLSAFGDGPIANPNMDGQVSVTLSKEAPAAELEAGIRLEDRCLHVNQFFAVTAGARAAGQADITLTETLAWDVQAELLGINNPNYINPLGIDIPQFRMTLTGNQDDMAADLFLPDQRYEVAALSIPLQLHTGMSLNLAPMPVDLAGSSPSLQAAGISLSEIQLGISGGVFSVGFNARADNIPLLRETFASYWPQDIDLTAFDGAASLVIDPNQEDPAYTLTINDAAGAFQDAPFRVNDARLTYDTRITSNSFNASFAGINAEVSQAPRPFPGINGGPPRDAEAWLALGFAFKGDDLTPLMDWLDLPEQLQLDRVQGTASFHADQSFDQKVAAFDVGQSAAFWEFHDIQLARLQGTYDNGLYLHNLDIDLDGIPVVVEPKSDGFTLKAEPNAADLIGWVDDVVGDADLALFLDWANTSNGTQMTMRAEQKSGRLIRLNPWTEFTALDVEAQLLEDGLSINKGDAIVNGGPVSLTGSVGFGEERNTVDIRLFADQMRMDLDDYKTNLTLVLEYKDNPEDASLVATVSVNEGYLTPQLEIAGAISNLLEDLPELYFPDPEEERVKLQILVVTPKPLILEHPIGYLEMTTPSLLIGGNLAEPRPSSGVVNINPGSSLNLGNRTYVFKDSAIQFYPNRENDPYLQLALESNRYGRTNTLNINGFVSELGRNVDTGNLTDVLFNYLLSQVTTLVSLQLGEGETLFDDSFTLVVSTPITRQLVTRYAFPVSQAKEQQRFELTMGPFYNNLINLIQQEDTVRGNIQHTREFGFLEREKLDLIKKVVWPKGTDKKLRREYRLQPGDVWSESAKRRARLGLERSLKSSGYLEPQITQTYEKGRVKLDVDPGPKADLVVTGISLTDQQTANLLRNLRPNDPASLFDLERRLENIAEQQFYPYAAAFSRFEDGTAFVDVRTGESYDGVNLDFGDANPLLAALYSDPQPRNQLVAAFLGSQEEAEDKVRAQLAAQGYLLPEIGEPVFLDPTRFSVPINPGLRGVLAAIVINGEEVQNDLVGAPFDYRMIGEMEDRLVKQDRDAIIKTRPERQDQDVVLYITVSELPDPVIKQLDISGASRITEERVRRFVGFKDEIKQEDLVRAQQRLIEAGPYQTVRMQTTEQEATLELQEGNRWDLDFRLSWDEERELGASVRLVDHQFMNRFWPLALQLERNAKDERIQAQLKFLRVFGSAADVTVGTQFVRGLEFEFFDESDDPFFTFRDFTRQESAGLRGEISYPLNRKMRLSLRLAFDEGRFFLQKETYDGFVPEEDLFSPDTLLDVFETREDSIRVPLRLSWVYNSLDHPSNPANGIIASITAEEFLDAFDADPGLLGTRYNARFTSFASRGRWMWSQRLELGQYDRPGETFTRDTENTANSPFFFLGGSRSVRGFSQNHVGVLDYPDSDWLPIGGEALAFFSQELSFDTRWFGMGLNPFVDGGWVWAESKQLLESDPVITGGLGLSFDLPIGYFRLDYAVPISYGSFNDLLDITFFDDASRDAAKKQALSELSFVFGRTF